MRAEEVEATVREIRAGDAALAARRTDPARQVPGVTTASTLELLSRAVREQLPVWLGYVDAQGSGSRRMVQPLTLGGGFLSGFDEGRGEQRTFAVHRITSVALVDSDRPAADGAGTVLAASRARREAPGCGGSRRTAPRAPSPSPGSRLGPRDRWRRRRTEGHS